MPADHASNRRRSLIRRARVADRSAYDALYAEAVASVWQVAAARWPRRGEAEAVTAAVLIAAFAELPGLPDHVDFTEHCLRLLIRASPQAAAGSVVAFAPADS